MSSSTAASTSSVLHHAREALRRAETATPNPSSNEPRERLQASFALFRSALSQLAPVVSSRSSDVEGGQALLVSVRAASADIESAARAVDGSDGGIEFLVEWNERIAQMTTLTAALEGEHAPALRASVTARLASVRSAFADVRLRLAEYQKQEAQHAPDLSDLKEAQSTLRQVRLGQSNAAAVAQQAALTRLNKLLSDARTLVASATTEVGRLLEGVAYGPDSASATRALEGARRSVAALEVDVGRANALGAELASVTGQIGALLLKMSTFDAEDMHLATRLRLLNEVNALGTSSGSLRQQVDEAKACAQRAQKSAATKPAGGLAGLAGLAKPAATPTVAPAAPKPEAEPAAVVQARALLKQAVDALHGASDEAKRAQSFLSDATNTLESVLTSNPNRRGLWARRLQAQREIEAARALERRAQAGVASHRVRLNDRQSSWQGDRLLSDAQGVLDDAKAAKASIEKATKTTSALHADAVSEVQNTKSQPIQSSAVQPAAGESKSPNASAQAGSAVRGGAALPATARVDALKTPARMARDPFQSLSAALQPSFIAPEALARSVAPRLNLVSAQSDQLAAQLSRLDAEVHRVRPFVPDSHTQLHASVAALDVRIEKTKGKQGKELADSTRDVAQSLGEMAALAEKIGLQSASTVKAVRALMDQRREALARLAVGESADGKARPADHAALDGVSRMIPGLDKVLRPSAKSRAKSAFVSSKMGTGGLAKLEGAAKSNSRQALLETAAGAGALQSLGQVPGVGALTVNDVLAGKLGKPYAKSWFSSMASSVSGAIGGLAKIGQSAVKSGLSAVKTTVSKAANLGGKVLGGAKAVVGGIAKLQKKVVSGALAAAVKGAGAGWNLVKKTAGALGSGMRAVSSKIGDAAAFAWDSTKHAAKLIGNGARAIANKTGGALKSAWSKTTGVVGAIGGKIKSGISSAASWAGDKVKKAGGALLGAAKWAGKKFLAHHPLGKALSWGWDKFGKKAWDKTKSLASVAWEGAKKVGKAAGNFLQSPAGQLLTTGLSIAASFIPGGMLVKAGIGAVMGAIEAVSKGGGLKEALMGAAMGGLEGAIPFLKLKTVGKLALGGVKGGLQAAINGGGLGDIAKGAAGGAFQVGGFAALKKLGGGRGVKMIDNFMTGQSEHSGVLGKLQKVANKGGLQKLYGGIQKISPKIVKGAGWVYEKSGKVHNILEKVTKGGEYAKGALEGVSWLSGWGAEKLGDTGLGRWLGSVSDLSQQGADGIEKPLEYVKKVDDVVEKVHKYTGMGLKLAGVDPKKQQKEAEKKRELQRRLRGQIEADTSLSPEERAKKLAFVDARTSTFDRVDNWVFNKTNKVDTGISKMKETFGKQVRQVNTLLGATPFGVNILKGGRTIADWGAKTHAHAQTLSKIYDKGVKVGDSIQSRLQDLILMTEGADESQWGGASMKWVHENAAKLEKDIDSKLKTAKKVQSVTHLAVDAGAVALDATGNKDKREKYGDNAELWWGTKKADPKTQTTVSGKPSAKVGKGEVAVAPWVKYGEKAEERLLGTEEDPTRLQQGIEKIEEWRKGVKKAADKAAENKIVIEKTEGDSVDASRARSGLRMLDGGDPKVQKDDWKAYQERQKKADAEKKSGEAAKTGDVKTTGEAMKTSGGPALPPPTPEKAAKSPEAAKVNKELAESVEKKVEERAGLEAKGVEKDEKQALADTHEEEAEEETQQAHAADAQSGAEANDELQSVFGALQKLEKARTAALETEQKSGKTPGMQPSLRMEALLLLGRIEWLAKKLGSDLAEHRERVLALMAFFNGGKAYHADDDRKGGLAGLPEVGDLPLAQTADDDGIAGREEKPQTGGLETLNEGFSSGFEGAQGISDDPRFAKAVSFLDLWEEQLLGDLPRLEYLALTDMVAASALYTALLQASRRPEKELEQLGLSIRPDEAHAPTLVMFAERYAGLRGRLRAIGSRLGSTAETEPEELSAAPEGEFVEMAVGGDVDATAGGETTPGTAIAPAEDGETYLDEAVGDTWIGSGAAARPIADGLANNFQFEDIDGVQPTIGGALARLGGALSGLGGSVKGAAGDVGGLAGELNTSVGLLGDMGGTVGELVGAGADNGFSEAMGKAGNFMDWVGEGAGKVAAGADKAAEIGGKLTEAGHKLEQNGLKLFGKVYRKGRAGTGVATKSENTAGDQYIDAPQRLDYAVTMQMERFLGANFRGVKIHTGKSADVITRRYEAEAVTIKDHIFFAPGRYNPSSIEGQKLIAHELTHVKQRTRPNLDTRTAEEEAHKAEALYGSPNMDVLDLSHPQADFQLAMAGAENGPAGIRTAKKQRSVTTGSGAHDEPAEGEELLDLVGEQVYRLMLDELERDFENH